jgi:ABC transporter substrate binding protein
MPLDQLHRREFITLLGGAATWPLAARAQQTKRIFKVGHLESGLPSSSPYLLAAFQQGLRKLGYIEGENLFIERRYAEGLEERLPQLAAELVRFGVDVIFAIGPPQALAAAKATSTIPIVLQRKYHQPIADSFGNPRKAADQARLARNALARTADTTARSGIA